VLDKAFLKRLAPFPEVTAELIGRAMDRSRRVAGHLVLAQLASVEHRVLLCLWHMADRWGRVTPKGIVLPVRLTHQGLGSVIGARRPSVTTALSSLEKQGLVCPLPGGGFRLTGEPPTDLKLVRGARRSHALDVADD
jgi:CRP-like cAMP-binding protein